VICWRRPKFSVASRDRADSSRAINCLLWRVLALGTASPRLLAMRTALPTTSVGRFSGALGHSSAPSFRAKECPNGKHPERLGAHDQARRTCALSRGARPSNALVCEGACSLLAGYGLSPIDLIPDFVPVLGYLDDVVIVPLGIWAVLKLIPPHVMAESRAAAARATDKPKSRTAALVIVLIWAASITLAGWLGYRCFAGSRQQSAPALDAASSLPAAAPFAH
jgi:uncharacterized membrane protein YkvA (DUF1232 family)